MNTQNHTAWRMFNNGKIGYVEWIGNGQHTGDRYSYTSEENIMKTSESYAGTYKLVYRLNGWKTLYKNGKEVGSTTVKGGIYAAANFFKV